MIQFVIQYKGYRRSEDPEVQFGLCPGLFRTEPPLPVSPPPKNGKSLEINSGNIISPRHFITSIGYIWQFSEGAVANRK